MRLSKTVGFRACMASVWALHVLSGSASGPLQQDQRFASSTGTTLVEVVAFVSDRNGVPVNGLTRDSFELDEDGVRQTISHFSFVELPRTSVKAAEASAPAAARSDVAGNENRSGRSYVIVLDSQHVDPLRTGSVKQQARKFISDYVEAGDAVAVVTVWEARALASEVHAGFVKLLADKYNYKGPVFCSMGEVLSVTGLEKHKADQEQTAGIDSRYPQGK